MRTLPSAAWLAAIIFVFRPPVLPAQSELEQLRSEVETLNNTVQKQQGTIQKLLDRINALEDAQKPNPVAPGLTPAQPAAATNFAPASQVQDRSAVSGEQLAAPRPNNELINSDGFFRIPGTETEMRIGGYVKTDFLYDLKNAGDPNLFITSSIPTSGDRGPRSNIQARQSRVSLELRHDSPFGPFKFYYENDFFGAGDETAFHLRHMYGQVTNFLAGYTYSAFMDPDALADTLDFEGPGSTVFLTQPQFRFMLPLKGGNLLSFSFEKPTTDAKVPYNGIEALSRTPDGIIQWRLERKKWHVQTAAVLRDVSVGTTHLHPSVLGWGFNLSGIWTLHGLDNILFQATYGHGISRYIEDSTGLGLDAGVARGPEFTAKPAVGALASYQHFWNPRLRSALTYGYLDVEPLFFDPSITFTRSTYLNGNLIWNPVGSLEIGAEYMYGWQVLVSGVKADAGRIQVSTKFDFIKKQTR
jgi:DcaP outer membrane protein